jgi:hypothetical protein
MGDDPMALLGLEGALKHYYYFYVTILLLQFRSRTSTVQATINIARVKPQAAGTASGGVGLHPVYGRKGFTSLCQHIDSGQC